MANEPARHRFTSRAEGDLASSGPAHQLAVRRAGVAPGSWTWLNQVHGSDVVVVTEPGQHAGARADGAVTATPHAVLAVTTADCAPVVLLGRDAVGVAHAGWRGVMAGVIGATVEAMRALDGSGPIRAVLGPCIRPTCYEFGEADLDEVAARYGDAVRSVSAWHTPALDLPAAVRAALGEAGVTVVDDDGRCTACSRGFFSYRARGDRGRQAAVAWLEAAEAAEAGSRG